MPPASTASTSPGAISRTNSAPTMSSAHVSEAKTQAVAEASECERPPAARVARRDERVADHHEQAVRPFDAGERLGDARLGRRSRRPGDAVDHDLGVHRRLEDRALVLERDAQLAGVDEVAVVRERDVPAAGPREHRLRVLERRGARGAVARVADGDRAGEALELRRREALADEPHALDRVRLAGVAHGGDAGGLLPAVLEGVEAELVEARRVGMPVDAEDAAHLLDGAGGGAALGRMRRGGRCMSAGIASWYASGEPGDVRGPAVAPTRTTNPSPAGRTRPITRAGTSRASATLSTRSGASVDTRTRPCASP
jgi:hypothetical protein